MPQGGLVREDLSSPRLYRSLNSSTRSIRLVRLLPGVYQSPLVCELQFINFESEQTPSYEALSYEWGVQDGGFSITLEKHEITVRENLFWALQHIRYPDAIRLVWIDALCINQDDVAEKNHQVALMSEIYSRASNVVIWLGVDAQMIDFETILLMSEPLMWKHHISALPTHLRQRLLGLGIPRLKQNPGACKPLYYAAYFLMQSTFDSWQLVEAFFNQSYWNRLWNYKRFFWQGRSLFNAKNDPAFRERLSPKVSVQTQGRNSYLRQIDNMVNTVPSRLCKERIKQRRMGWTPQPLLDLVLRYHDAKCQKLVDKVFGLHSLSQNCCKQILSVDYSQSPSEIYTILLQHHFAHHSTGGSGLQILQQTGTLGRILKVRNFCHSIQKSSEVPGLHLSRVTLTSGVRIPFQAYSRGPILHVDQPARITQEVRYNQSTSILPMPTILNHAIRTSMRSFLRDAREYLPTTIKPDYTGRSLKKKVSVLAHKTYHSLVARFKKERIWSDWLWGLELPDHEELWQEVPYIFFTGDGQIGLSVEKPELGHIVVELDRRRPESLVLRRRGQDYMPVTISSKVLGAWGPTPSRSLPKFVSSLVIDNPAVSRLKFN